MQRARVGQGLGGREQLVGGVHAQHAGAPDRGVEHGVAARQGAAFAGGGRQGIVLAPGAQHQHRLAARRRARGRHELARIAQVLQVEQDGAGGAVAGEVIEHVAEVDVGRVAQRDKVGKADAAGARPVQHPDHQRARLRHEGDPSGQRAAGGDAGVESQAGRQQAGAVRPEQAQQVGMGRVQHGLAQAAAARAPSIAHAAAQDHRGAGAALAQLAHDRGNRRRRGADHGQGRGRGQVGHARITAPPGQFAVLGVDRPDLALESARQQVVQQRRAQAARPLGRADQRHRLRCEQVLEVANAHAVTFPRMTRAPLRPAREA